MLIPSGHARRAGFTLVELLITIVLLGLVMGALLNVVVRQQRFYHGASEIIDIRSQVRQATHLLPSDLRGISTAGGAVGGVSVTDLYPGGMERHAISFRSSFGSSIACITDAGRTQLTLPPLDLASGTVLTAWLRQPVAGDSLFVFDDMGVLGGTGQWLPREIASVTTLVDGCPASTGFTAAADAGKDSWLITLSTALPATVPVGTGVGTPVRFFQPVTYELIQAADGLWYLGYSDCRTGRTPVCTDPQPVAGPYLPPSTDESESGLTIRYLDATGVDAATPDDVASIRITFLGETPGDVQIQGLRTTDGRYRDSLSVLVAVRNRS